MASDIPKMSEDNRPILGAWTDDGQTGATVGHRGVTAIKPYHELGEMSPVTWLAVYRNDVLYKRMNLRMMTEVFYEKD